jgi:carboxypeptidase C (cathepsin A)
MKLSVLIAFAAVVPLLAQAQPEEPIVVTRHQVTIGAKTLPYTARAGRLPIRDNDAGEVHGNMFFVSYTLDGPAGSTPRPLTFLWNGGPGSNAGLVHLLGFGPKRVARATGSMPLLSPSGTALVENKDTWFAFSDLVFVDPIGTGYSRPAQPEYTGEFYQNRGDAEAVAEFIRVYRTHFDAFDAPLFILGESYGVTRCALVADGLERRHAGLTGVIMLSGGFPLVQLEAAQRNALNLPTLTAAAYYNHKLPPDLGGGDLLQAVRAAETYAKGKYAAALAKPDALSGAQRDAVVTQLVRFTGLPSSRIDRDRLVVPMEQFSAQLLADHNLMVGRYDSRLIGPRDPSPQYDPTTDPSLKDILDGVSVIRYLRNEIGYKSDLFYQGPFGGGYPPPTKPRGDWMSVRWNFGSAPATGGAAAGATQRSPVEAFQSAMKSDPKLRTMVVSGYYDLVSSYFAIEQASGQLPADLARRVTIKTYAGGHAIYTDDAVRHQLRIDGEKFYQAGAMQ